ncbi:taste receptor type 2 member 7-like [Eleutherodactylus coqui]|uniref:taste receptor type 2 member 7-like n=1 Tax=Eleutherodactylus coqui TaxID=57060 RepID=UPI003463171A
MAAPFETIENHILVLAVGLLFLAGFLINVFIVAVNISEWKKGRPVSTTDKIITSLGISRMVFQVVCLLDVIWYTYLYTPRSLFFMLDIFLQFTSIYSEIWLSTLLSAVFFFKISTFQNAFFLWLKILVLNRVFHLIVVSVMVSVSYSLVYCLMFTLRSSHNSTQDAYDNLLMGVSEIIFLKTGPFIIYLIFSVLLLIYLYHHVSRMRSRRNETSHLDTYYKTMKFTGFSIFYAAAYIFTDQTTFWSDILSHLVHEFLWQVFPTLHSIYLIYMTAKLRIQVSNMIHFLRRRCGDPKAPVDTAF